MLYTLVTLLVKQTKMIELTHDSLNLTADLMFYYQHLSMHMPM